MLLFFAPLVAAFIVYYGFSWRPSGSTNKGVLVSPAVPLPALVLPTPDGKLTAANFLQNKWTLLYIGDGQCAAACRTALENTRQVRRLLGKEISRVQRVFLYSNACCEKDYFEAQQQDLIKAQLNGDASTQLLPLFPTYNGTAPLEAGRTYIVDPLGNLMMSYVAGVDPRDILQDIKKLLNLSHVG
jgi:cytochrome oxidase Cu insertion factor (SCO1/SenC/PrrC family)